MCNVSGAKLGTEEVIEAKVIEEEHLEEVKVEKAVVKKVKSKTKYTPNSSKIVIPSKEEIRALRGAFYNI